MTKPPHPFAGNGNYCLRCHRPKVKMVIAGTPENPYPMNVLTHPIIKQKNDEVEE